MATAKSILGDLEGKVVFVTGSSSGIGAACAVEYAKLGLKVALHGRSEPRLQQTFDACVAAGAKPENILKTVASLDKPDEIDKACDQVIEKFGTVHMFVSNAGATSLGGGVEGTTLEELEFMLQVNCKAPFQIAKRLRPHILKNKGSIVFVSSDSARLPGSTMLAYSTSKAALTHMAKAMALEFAETGVRVNIISPCWVRTSALKTCGFTKTDEESEKVITDNLKYMVCQRIPYPDEVARLIVYISSEGTPYLNGQDIVLDGGNILTSLATHGWWLDRDSGDGGVLADLENK